MAIGSTGGGAEGGGGIGLFAKKVKTTNNNNKPNPIPEITRLELIIVLLLYMFKTEISYQNHFHDKYCKFWRKWLWYVMLIRQAVYHHYQIKTTELKYYEYNDETDIINGKICRKCPVGVDAEDGIAWYLYL